MLGQLRDVDLHALLREFVGHSCGLTLLVDSLRENAATALVARREDDAQQAAPTSEAALLQHNAQPTVATETARGREVGCATTGNFHALQEARLAVQVQ